MARAAGRRARAGADPAAGAALAGHLMAAGVVSPGCVVAGFWPLPGEIDLRPLLAALHGRGQPLALPCTPPRGRPLSFHRWSPGDPLLPGRFGTLHPAGPPVTPDVVLAPLLAFDAAGNRLGHGGGYYDRTLAGLPGALAIGCAFAVQQVACVPAGPTDVRLALIATERGILHTSKA